VEDANNVLEARAMQLRAMAASLTLAERRDPIIHPRNGTEKQ